MKTLMQPTVPESGVNCCVFWPAFGCCAHPKASQTPFFQPFTSFFVHFLPFFSDFTPEINKKCLKINKKPQHPLLLSHQCPQQVTNLGRGTQLTKPSTHLDTSPKSEPTLELHRRAAPSVEAHHHVSSPNTGRNSRGRRKKILTPPAMATARVRGWH